MADHGEQPAPNEVTEVVSGAAEQLALSEEDTVTVVESLPFIMRISTELLSEILRYAIMPSPTPNEEYHLPIYNEPTKVLRTCRKFRDVGTRLLYAHIIINVGTSDKRSSLSPAIGSGQKGLRMEASEHLWRLHRTLQMSPALGKHCKTFELRVRHVHHPRATAGTIHELVALLPNITSISAVGPFRREGPAKRQPIWPLPMKKWHHLQHLCVSRRYWSLPMSSGATREQEPTEKAITALSSLKSLEICGLPATRGKPWCDYLWEEQEPFYDIQLLEQAKGNGSFTSLTLWDVGVHETPGELKALLDWPAKLEHFACNGDGPDTFSYVSSCVGRDWHGDLDQRFQLDGNSPRNSQLRDTRRARIKLEDISAMLERQKSTLKTLVINKMQPEGHGEYIYGNKNTASVHGAGGVPSSFDLREFTALEELTMSYWDTCRVNKMGEWNSRFGFPTKLALLAPRLKVFRWDFTRVCCSIRLSKEQTPGVWLREFAAAAHKHKSPLQLVEIIYAPNSFTKKVRTAKEHHTFSPQVSFDRVAQTMREWGIQVRYLQTHQRW